MEYQYQRGSERHDVTLETSAHGLRAVIAGQTYAVAIIEQQPGRLIIRIEDQIYNVHWAVADQKRWISLQGCTYELEKPSPRARALSQESGAENQLRAPMPAQVREVFVTAGDEVVLGAPLLILEAMKMEIRLTAPTDARVVDVLANVGDSVERDQVLIQLEKA